jgi:hypothetical protein
LPSRSNVDPNFLYSALAETVASSVGHYHLTGDANGVIPIQSVVFSTTDAAGVPGPVVNGQPAYGTITLTFANPLPDDRFTLTVDDELVDPAGNRLDGESNTVEPQGAPIFPSGDGVPGGDFVARFTVDSRPELGVAAGGSVWVDTNGNFKWDATNADSTNRDLTYAVQYKDPITGVITDRFVTTDDVFAGKFTAPGPAVSDGFDKLAAYGRIGNDFRWLVDINNDGVAEVREVNRGVSGAALNINGHPIAWNFDSHAANGDEVGLVAGQTWWLDVTHTYHTTAALELPLLPVGLPFVGDFDGNGAVDFGTWKDDQFTIYMNPILPTIAGQYFPGAVNSNPVNVQTINFGFIGTRERPVAADMDRDGVTDLGLWVPDRTGTVPQGSGEWYWLMSTGTAPVVGTVNALNHAFSPTPLGQDLHAVFGDQFAIPVVGNFDPPVVASSVVSGHTNPTLAGDVNADGAVTAYDVLLLVNTLNVDGARKLTTPVGSSPYLDPNNDGSITASDVLYVINYINTHTPAFAGEGEGFATPDAVTVAARLDPAPLVPAVTVPAWRTAASVSQPVNDGLLLLGSAADQALQSLEEEGLLSDLVANVGAARQDMLLEDLFFEELGG